MADKIAIHILRRADLKSPAVYDRFDDPDALARPSAAKLMALIRNPLAGGDDEPAQLVGVSGNRVIGRLDLIPGEVTVGAGPASRVFWGSNLVVPPAFRKTLMGVMLIMKASGLGATAAAFGPSQAALPIYQKLRWVDLPLSRYIMIVRSRPVVRRYVKSRPAAAALTVAADAALALHRVATAAWRVLRTRGLRVEVSPVAPPEWDARFAARTEAVRVHRSAAFLNWQLTNAFTDEPRNRSVLFAVRDRQANTLGYFLVKARFHETATHRGFKDVLLGSLQDWMTFDPTTLDAEAILTLAVRELVRLGVDAVDFCTPDASLRTTLALLGFKRLGELHLLYKARAGDPLVGAARGGLSQWWIRPGDGDNFFV